MKTFFPLPHAPILPASLPSVAECCPNSILIDGEGKRLIKNGSADCAAAVSFPVKRRVCACMRARVYQSIPGAFRYNNVMFCIEALHHMKVEMYLVKREKSLKKQECSCLALEKTVW